MSDAPRPTPTAVRASWARRSVSLKMVAIAGLILLLLVPLMLLRGLIGERQRLRDDARREVAAQWGLAQTVGGPVLSIPFVTSRLNARGALEEVRGHVHVLPDELDVEGTLTPEVRRRGIFRVVLYHARLRVRGRFPQPDTVALGLAPGSLRPAEAFLSIGIPDMKGIREPIRIAWNGGTVEADPGVPTSDVFASGVSAPVPLAIAAPAGGYVFAADLSLNGSGRFGVLPVGKETRVRLSAPWPTPSFTGAFLPETREVTADGFTASWRVLHLNRNYGQVFRDAFGHPTALLDEGGRGVEVPYVEPPFVEGRGPGSPSAFGVALLLPIDEYQKAERAAKYGLLFVGLTFLTFFFVEVLGGRRIHPMQYLLVGFAVTLFYLLLLSFAEYVPFDGAYLLAMASVLALVGLYAKAIFGGWRLAGAVTGLLLLFYGYFYVLLQLEAYALLFGSLGLLVTLALVMYLSRSVDWYGVGAARAGAAPTTAPPDGPDGAAA